jgi:hypothetical protein
MRARLIRWAALPLTDRRWSAPLSAIALGMGLFVGVAIGPGAAGTLATGASQVIEIPGFGGSTPSGREEGNPTAASSPGSGSGTSSPPAEESPSPLLVPAATEPIPFGPPAKEPVPQVGSPPEDEPTKPEAEVLVGVVVHVNPAAGSYTVAESGGVMSAVHAGKLPAPGTKVSVPIRLLANGTLAEAGEPTTSGRRTRATLAGVVSFVGSNPADPAYAVSNRGVSALVHIHPDPTAPAPQLPALGAYASVAVEIGRALPEVQREEAPGPTGGCAPDPAFPAPPAVKPEGVLWQRNLTAGGAPFTHSDFEGVVEAVCPESRQLSISADDVGESGSTLLFTAPPNIDPTAVEVGESVAVTADISPDGSLTLTGLACDERLKGADDASTAQGELVPSKEKQ